MHNKKVNIPKKKLKAQIKRSYTQKHKKIQKTSEKLALMKA